MSEENQNQESTPQDKADSIKKSDIKTAEKPAGKKNQKATVAIIVGAVVVVILGAGIFAAFHLRNGRFIAKRGFNGFYGRSGYGMKGGRGMMGGGYGFRGGNFNSGNTISGKVTAVNGQTLTIDASGTSKTVQISDSTRFPIGSATDIKTGDQVVVFGEQDSKGTVQATRIIDRTNVQTQSDTQIQNPSETPQTN